VVRIDDEGDVLVYRDGDMPREVGTPSPLRQQLRAAACPYPEASPYVITAERVTTVDQALEWVAHVGGKRWGTGSTLYSLGKALAKVLRSHEGRPEDFEPTLETSPRARRSLSHGESTGKGSA